MTDTEEKATPKILPCPFCGSEKFEVLDDYDAGEYYVWVHCRGCNASGPDMNPCQRIAVERWNKVAGPQQAADEPKMSFEEAVEACSGVSDWVKTDPYIKRRPTATEKHLEPKLTEDEFDDFFKIAFPSYKKINYDRIHSLHDLKRIVQASVPHLPEYRTEGIDDLLVDDEED